MGLAIRHRLLLGGTHADPTLLEAGPLYCAFLCGFVGIAEHLIAADSRDVNNENGFHTTLLHAASVKGK